MSCSSSRCFDSGPIKIFWKKHLIAAGMRCSLVAKWCSLMKSLRGEELAGSTQFYWALDVYPLDFTVRLHLKVFALALTDKLLCVGVCACMHQRVHVFHVNTILIKKNKTATCFSLSRVSRWHWAAWGNCYHSFQLPSVFTLSQQTRLSPCSSSVGCRKILIMVFACGLCARMCTDGTKKPLA